MVESPNIREKRTFIVGGNWKLNGDKSLIETLTTKTLANLPSINCQIIVAPQSPYLVPLREAVLKASLPVCVAAQNINENLNGAFTGEISLRALEDLSVEWVIIGHSERRKLYGESSKLIGEKLNLVLKNSNCLKVIVCVGETLEEREKNLTKEVLIDQLQALLPTSSTEWKERVVIAYEPVWAIGTGNVATPEQAQSAHQIIRAWVTEQFDQQIANRVPIIYGGSVTASNCQSLANQEDIDGFLVGGASIKPEFRDIVLSAPHTN